MYIIWLLYQILLVIKYHVYIIEHNIDNFPLNFRTLMGKLNILITVANAFT